MVARSKRETRAISGPTQALTNNIDALLLQVEAEECRRSLKTFAKSVWNIIEPNPFIDGMPLDAMIEHLEAVARGDIRRLVINIPPRHTKSTLLTIWRAWIWLQNPSERFLCASYSLDLSTRDNLRVRRIIEDPWFQARFGKAFQLAGDQNVKRYFENTERGYQMAISVDGGTTGQGGSYLVLDDPHNADEAHSDADRQTALIWFREVWTNRLNDQQKDKMVVVGQRIHDDDVCGYILKERPDWIHLNLPAYYEPSHPCVTSIWKDPRTEEGQLLWPERFSKAVLDGLKRDLGSMGFAAQYQQRPVPAGGGQFKKQWFRYYTAEDDHYVLELPEGITRIQKSKCWYFSTVDLAISLKQTADYTVIATWAVTPDKDLLLVDCVREHLDNPEQQKQIGLIYRKYNPNYFKVENVAYQLALIQQLRRQGLPVREYKPVKDKVSRASTASVYYEAGKVYHPKYATWLADWEDELLMFPLGSHDDQCVLPTTKLPYLPHEGDKTMLVGEAQELEEGQFLLTHTGTWKKITQVLTRSYYGEIVSIKPQGGIELTLTPEHPIFCVKRTGKGEFFKPRAVGEPQWIPASEVVPGDSVLEAIDQKIVPIEQIDLSTFLLAERSSTTGKRSRAGLYISQLIIDSDMIRFKNPRSHPVKRFVPVNKDFCRLVGYYLAEGSRGKHNISWAFHTNEQEYLEDVRNLLDILFGVQPSTYTRGNSTSLSVSSLVLHDFFAQFGRGAGKKMIPQWIMHLPHDLQIEVLKGAWRGDGCVTGKYLEYVSSSLNLIIALRMMLYRLGFVPIIAISRPDGASGHVIDGKTVRYSHPLYGLRVGGEYASQFAMLVGKNDPRVGIVNGRVSDRIVDGYVHRRVRKVEFHDYEGPVFNFEVEQDHSYQTESFLVHNCDALSMAAEELGMPGKVGGMVLATGDEDLEGYEEEDLHLWR